MENEVIFNKRWLYKQFGNDIKGSIIYNQSDYDLMVSEGYKDSPKKCKPEPKKEIEKPSDKEIVTEPEVEEVKEEVSVSELHKDDDELDLMTKEQLVDFAKENFNKELKVRDTKVSLINEIKALKEG